MNKLIDETKKNGRMFIGDMMLVTKEYAVNNLDGDYHEAPFWLHDIEYGHDTPVSDEEELSSIMREKKIFSPSNLPMSIDDYEEWANRVFEARQSGQEDDLEGGTMEVLAVAEAMCKANPERFRMHPNLELYDLIDLINKKVISVEEIYNKKKSSFVTEFIVTSYDVDIVDIE